MIYTHINYKDTMMYKKILGLVMAPLIASLFSGCVGSSEQLTVKELPQNKHVTFNFPSKDPVSGEAIVFDLKDYLSDKHTKVVPFLGKVNWNVLTFNDEVLKLSKYERFHRIKKGRHYYGGTRVTPIQDGFELSYENGENSKGYILDKTIFTINYVKADDNSTVFTFPKTFVHQAASNIIGIEMDRLDSPNHLEEDAKHVFNRLDKVVLKLRRNYTLKGEVDTTYGDRSVYGNFERMLGKYDWSQSQKEYSNEIKKENTYTFTYGKESYPLGVAVYPYRDGSKVVYTLYIDYIVNSDGTCSLSTDDMESIKEKIVSIANN